ncbi:MAG: PAS domain-containing sensor histidine kinase [Ignavibacteria bacterium]|nr:PAS domain-containing sensor histidine kinase [Ignavibacteria bacterium]
MDSEKKYRELFNRMQSGFAYHEIILNKRGKVVDYKFLAVNPMFEKLTGLKNKDIVNRTVLEILPGTEKYWFETYGKVALTGKPIRFEHFSKTIGKYFKVLAYSPEKYRFATIIEDISERRHKEKELEEYRNHLEREVDLRTHDLYLTNAQLQQEIVNQKNTEALLKASLVKEKELSELKTRFISTISHEFRTPLTSILSSTELLQKYGQKWDADKFGEHVDRTMRAVEYLVRLLEDVLTISRTESGKIGFNPTLINLKDICKEVIEESISQAKDNHKFAFRYNLMRKEFNLDSKLLKFILVNLIVNAFKYSPNGGEIKFIVSGDKKNIFFTVSDQGMGITNSEKPFVYDNFFRSKNSSDIPGTGLGLSIVKRSAELHHGSVNFISKLKTGTTFKVSLPKEYHITDIKPAMQAVELNHEARVG